MSTQGLRQFIERDARRSIVPDFDLNIPPPAPTENMAPDCITFHASSQGFPAELHRGSQLQLRNSVEVIDDDIAIIDRSTFTEAKNNSRRNHSQFTDGLRDVLNEAGVLINSLSELTELTELAELATWCSKPRRTASDEAEDLCMIVGASKSKSPVKNVLEPPEFPQNPVVVAPVFNCPICIGPLKDATTTRCGHIYCKECIEKAIAAQSKCPTCRKKLGKRGIFRVYLPPID
ncbi:hypothetical protein LWI29_011782 [Acer saccharum]|uniref:RING-type domain-containing protein n=1 Tax=Acer saccharum TaxID=4024 RepID=A0AA39TSA4_ACESA|nr:hypothetical protein LWI29_011782 [Acer saccharum]KAK1592275.1 hypothetical protein Q3G72_022131 [Acer saccharum]